MAAVNFRIAPHLDQENLSHPVVKGSSGKSQGLNPVKSLQTNYATPRKALGDIRNTGIQRSGTGFKKPLSSVRNQVTSRHLHNKDIKPVPQKLKGLTPLQNRPKSQTPGLQQSKRHGIDESKDTSQEFPHPINLFCTETYAQRDRLKYPTEKEHMYPFKEPDYEYQKPLYLQKMTPAMAKEKFWPPFTMPVNRKSKFVINIDDYSLEDIKPAMSEPSLLDAVASDLSGFDITYLENDPLISLDELDNDLKSLELSF